MTIHILWTATHSETVEEWTIFREEGSSMLWARPTAQLHGEDPPTLSELPAELRCGRYQHFKEGNFYWILQNVVCPETLEPLGLYQRENSTRLWVRPSRMFTEEVAWPDGTKGPRFRPA